ncbi:MAG TPA: M36 family metallopeptidase, partial [Actinomycetota bacterium]
TALPVPAGAIQQPAPHEAPLPDIDTRLERRLPTADQLAIVRDLGAHVDWNTFGTPASLIRYGGYLATGLSRDAVRAARAFVSEHRALFGLSSLRGLRLLADARMTDSDGHAVIFTETWGGLPAGWDGLITVGVANGKVAYVSSSALGDAAAPAPATMGPRAAWLLAAQSIGIHRTLDDLTATRSEDGDVLTFDADGLRMPQRARLVAFPALEGVRTAWEVDVRDFGPGVNILYTLMVDARGGDILFRHNRVSFEDDPASPRWDYFTAYPPLNFASTDTRITGCWTQPGALQCDALLSNPASPFAWDMTVASNTSSNTVTGNNAEEQQGWVAGAAETAFRPISTAREYLYPWTNQWQTMKCSPAAFVTPQRVDSDAAQTNLFVAHNRMHDWSYRLGFTEANWNMQEDNFGKGGTGGDPEVGNAQSGALTGSRNNANQGTGADGSPGSTNMYVWQPSPAGSYAPCVDGDYDMQVVAHEYTHAISNRMIAGPSQGIGGSQGGAMGESWSDQVGSEINLEYGYTPIGDENPFALGPYVTGNRVTGIRNYAIGNSPLTYGELEYDAGATTSVHANGEIWGATGFSLRELYLQRYDEAFPSSDMALQRDCADGVVPVDQCPGNRRWIQNVFDAFLLMQSSISMLNARDAYLAADMLRTGGANQDLLWTAFARRGMGESAVSNGSGDLNAVPAFDSPQEPDEAVLTFRPVSAETGEPVAAKLFVGTYEARAVPIADALDGTTLDDTAPFVPGTYRFLATAPGHGFKRFTLEVPAVTEEEPDNDGTLLVRMPANWASGAQGGAAGGEGTALASLIDDTESTAWSVTNRVPDARGATVTVDLGGEAHDVTRVQVSALTATRYSAVRQFEIWTCDATAGADCAGGTGFEKRYTSPPDAFPGDAYRPFNPQLQLRTFDVPAGPATHVRLVVLHNQCTGGPLYQGEQDDDPRTTTGCIEGSTADSNVYAAELQVFGGDGSAEIVP